MLKSRMFLISAFKLCCCLIGCCLYWFSSSAFSQATLEDRFPPLSGRIVDLANMLSSAQEQSINARLAAHEDSTSNQLVVLTVTNLLGYTIEEYGYRLGRHWGIGQAEKNNGVLLIVAERERKVRIEVGYGLEGALTDALSQQIIQREIIPLFKKGDFSKGIDRGVEAILSAIEGEYSPEKSSDSRERDGGVILPIIFFGVFLGRVLFGRHITKKKKSKTAVVEDGIISSRLGFGALAVAIITSATTFFFTRSLILTFIVFIVSFIFFLIFEGGDGGGSGGSYHHGSSSRVGGGFGGGGFSGGGGSFGGGGASGGW